MTRPNPNLPLYDMQCDEAIEVLIEDKELYDTNEHLSFEIVRAWRLRKIMNPLEACLEYITIQKKDSVKKENIARQ